MSSSAGGPSEPPEISGHLSKTPLFAVVRRLQREQLSGTLSVIRGDQVRQLVFENGELYAARSSQEEHRIGATLVRWGYISEQDLREALESQQQTHERIDRILVEKGLVTRVVVDSEARRQMEQIVFSTLAWPDGAFHFEANTGPIELDIPMSLSQEMIIEGIRRIPESEQFLELLGDLSGVPTLTRDPLTSGTMRLLRDTVGLLSQIDGKTSLRELLSSSSIAATPSAKILYSLLFAGIIDVHLPGEKAASEAAERRKTPRRAEDRGSGAYLYDLRSAEVFRKTADTGVLTKSSTPEPATAAPPAVEPKGPSQNTRNLVLGIYRQLDWLSHYDLLGISRKASPAEIEDAYRERSRLFDPSLKAHPELVDCWRELSALNKWLRVAYGILSKPESRQTYDRKIEEAAPVPPPDAGKTS